MAAKLIGSFVTKNFKKYFFALKNYYLYADILFLQPKFFKAMKKTLLSVFVIVAMSSFTLLNAQNFNQAKDAGPNPVVSKNVAAEPASKNEVTIWAEGFETVTTPASALPPGWVHRRTAALTDVPPTTDAPTPRWVRLDLVNNLVFGPAPPTVEGNQPYVRTGNASMVTGYTAPNFTWAITSDIVIPANNGGTTRLSFWTWYTNVGGAGTYPTNYHVRVLADGVWTTAFSMIGSATVPNNIWNSAVVVPLGAFEGKTIKLAFVYEYTDGYQMAIDDISITATPPVVTQQVTFNVNMTPAGTAFNPLTHKVHIAGSFPAPNTWNEPGTNANLELTRVGTTMIWTRTLNLPAGTYGYKFFSTHVAPGWNGGEWTGDPNRPLTVGTANMTINAIWGDITNNVPTVELPEFTVFPNPTSGDIKVSGQATIQSVRVLNMLGQQVIGLNNLDTKTVTLPTADLRAGYYIVSVTDISGNTVNNRFMKR